MRRNGRIIIGGTQAAPRAATDHKPRAIRPDGRLVYPGDPAEPRANVGQLAVVGVCETVA